jgi:hypothetical protein
LVNLLCAYHSLELKKLAVILLVLAVSFGSSNVFSQGAPKPIFGVKGGLNLADIAGQTDAKMKTAFHAGVYSHVFFDYFLMMQMEILLSNQGHAPFDDQPSGSALNLWYINLPIIARYNLGYNFNVHAGFQFGVLLSANSKPNDSTLPETDVKDQFKEVDFGIPVGIGYEFWDRKFNVTIRYIIPINNISNSTSAGQKLTNIVFQASIGIMLYRPK